MILLLEKVVQGVLEHPDRESCIFGKPNFYFREKDGQIKVMGPYDFYFYQIPGIPSNLDTKFSVIPYLPGTINDDSTKARIRKLVGKFPFLDNFAFVKQTGANRSLSIRKFEGIRPRANIRNIRYQLKLDDLERETSNSKVVLDYIGDKVRFIEKNYRPHTV